MILPPFFNRNEHHENDTQDKTLGLDTTDHMDLSCTNPNTSTPGTWIRMQNTTN